MTFSDWQQLSPGDAARLVHARLRERLTPAQARAAVAFMLPEMELARALAAARTEAPLRGVPYFAKDLFDVAGLPTGAGSTFLPQVRAVPAQDSPMIAALRSSGAALAGKTQLHEFAYGITGDNPHFGHCEHPRFPGRTAGGSSSGSAAVVSAGIVPFATGTDTGGSIRVPAAFCGVYGLRLPVGHPLGAGLFPLARSFDTAGWFTAGPADLLATLRALIATATVAHTPAGLYLEPAGLDPDVATACRAAADRFAPPADRATRDVLLNRFAGSTEKYSRVVAAEAWAVHQSWAATHRAAYARDVLARLERGRDLGRQELDQALVGIAAVELMWAKYFLAYDFLLLPATPFGALPTSECTPQNRERLLALTTPVSLGGLPVLTIPVPLPSGLTTGLQLVARDVRGPVFPWALWRCAEARATG
jgi:amidase/aspartyl-tRNA(Asn)/glutamyl-tRNA(Gln) amidotransferase subunit A